MYAASVAVMAASVDGFDSGYYFSDGRWPVVWLQHDDSQAGVHVPPHMESLLDASPLEKRGPPGGYDGVAPSDGAGGNTGRHGCVVFKQKVDECVGRTTESFEEVPSETLNRCFASR
jgi:hypothetical protein